MLILLQGFSTAPNSPSVNSRSGSLGPSLSLGNISGMTANPEVKKRRAPPPPVATPALQNMETSSGQDKTAAQVTVTPQNGLLCLACWLPSVQSSELKPLTTTHQNYWSYKLKLSKVLEFCTYLLRFIWHCLKLSSVSRIFLNQKIVMRHYAKRRRMKKKSEKLGILYGN